MTETVPKLNYWGERGFARAIAALSGSEVGGEYPTQDRYSPQDESDFISGFNLGHRIFQTHGFETAAAYLSEAKKS